MDAETLREKTLKIAGQIEEWAEQNTLSVPIEEIRRDDGDGWRDDWKETARKHSARSNERDAEALPEYDHNYYPEVADLIEEFRERGHDMDAVEELNEDLPSVSFAGFLSRRLKQHAGKL